MLKINESTTYMASSIIEIAHAATQIAHMNATVQQNGNISINSIIQNYDLFTKHKDDVLADIRSFEDMVYESV